MSKILTDEIVEKYIEKEYGLKEGISAEEAQTTMLDEWGCDFNYVRSWAEGHEDLVIYSETTYDGYEIFVVTDNHDGDISICEDVFYYTNGGQFMEKVIDTLRIGGMVWIDPYIAEDIRYDIDEAFENEYVSLYEEKFEEATDNLINDGYEPKN